MLLGVETAASPSRSLAGSREVVETLGPQGREWRKKSPSSSISSSEALILLLRFPASFPSQSCPPWLAATDVCGGEVTQGCLSCRSSGWGKWGPEGQRREILQRPYPGANREPACSPQSVLNHPAPATLPRPAEHQAWAKDAEILPWPQGCKPRMGMAPCPSLQPHTLLSSPTHCWEARHPSWARELPQICAMGREPCMVNG